jgi:crotonobetainyl-CoA:carnitine CoA-transferase CaiB-like acyl-CoA transferase
MMLGDLGADVIKIERPGLGDDTREWGPPFDGRGESAYYLSVNRNKISLAADLGDPASRQMVLELIRGANIVVDNFLPGTLPRLGFDVAEILRRHQNLVWCTITGFGATSRRPGYDYVVQAEAGWMAITGDADGEPARAGIALADVITGKDAAIAILAALVATSRGARSDRHLVVSLADSARAALINVAQNALVSGEDARRWGNAHPNLVPYQLFSASDRSIVIAVGTDEQWRACARVLGLLGLESDPGLATNRGRLSRRREITAAFDQVLAQRSAAEWVSVLDQARVPCGLVKTVLEVIEDTAGASALTGMPSPVGGSPRIPPPRLDEQGDLIRQKGWGAFQLLGR